MNTYSGSSLVKTGSCGCGGSTTPAAGGCSCGGGGCSSCQNQDYVRPNFFAGQLLTEEDLQSLSNYVVAKNRLHNRYLFGAGVVCGLDVSCNPCGGGTVIVNSGYALDCCGNDITVACATELDINKMIRELRRDMLGGYDCGDPCEEPEPPSPSPAPVPPPKPVRGPSVDIGTATVAPAAAGTGTEVTPLEPVTTTASIPTRHYCLYVRYCEQMSDPVSPYATDEPCGYQTCEPTRVREGFRFELRCPPKAKEYNDVLSKLCGCVTDRVSAKRSLRDAASLDNYFTGVKASPATYDLNNIAAHTREINAAARTAKEAIATAQKEGTEEAVSNAVEATRVLATYPARYLVADEATQQALAGNSAFGRALTEARNQLGQAAALTDAIKSQRISDLDRAFATTVINSADELAKVSALSPAKVTVTKKAKGGLPAASASASATATTPPVATPPTPELQAKIEYMARGAFYEPRVGMELVSSLKAMKEELLESLDRSPHLTDCALRKEVSRIAIPDEQPGQTPANQQPEFSALETAKEQLKAARYRYFRDCVCAAVNPPCQPCDDMGVLLACLEVKECEVIRICNLERTFVLSSPALRYWFCLDRLSEQLEEICCSDVTPSASSIRSVHKLDARSDVFAQLLRVLMRVCPEKGAREFPVKEIAAGPIRHQTALARQPALDQENLFSTIASPIVSGLTSQLDMISAVSKRNEELLAEVKRLKTVADKTTALEERIAKLEGGK